MSKKQKNTVTDMPEPHDNTASTKQKPAYPAGLVPDYETTLCYYQNLEKILN